jgi:hypothetical protein
MISINEAKGDLEGHLICRRVLLYFEVSGCSPEESLELAQRVLARKPKNLPEAMEIVRAILPSRPPTTYPPSFPSLNRSSMVTDKEANGDFFNDLEL